MLKILNKHKKLLIIFSFVYIYIVLMLIAPSGFTALTPGAIDATNNKYDIENVEFTNDINTISVFSWHSLSIFQKWIIEKNSKFVVEEKTDIEKELSLKEQRLQGNISKESSHNNALITAYKYASMVKNEISIDYDFKGLTVYYTNNKELEIGDVIYEINNTKINTNDYEKFLSDANIFHALTGSNKIQNENYNVKVLRDKVETSIDIKSEEGLIFYPKYEIIKTNPKYNKHVNEANTGGPSGGMIQTLAIYSALLNIKTNNIKIAGTGTIENNELSSVGRIGGLVQKFYTVKKAKVDHFIIPSSQYNEINHLDKNIKFKIHKVDTFQDVITLLNSIVGGL